MLYHGPPQWRNSLAPLPSTGSTAVSTAEPQRGLLESMKVLLAFVILVASMVGAGPVAASDYSADNRPQLVFPGHGGIVHQSPYPQSKRSARVWNNDACWEDCQATCTSHMAGCTPSAGTGADSCRPALDACDRSCQRSCRSFFARPALDFIDW